MQLANNSGIKCQHSTSHKWCAVPVFHWHHGKHFITFTQGPPPAAQPQHSHTGYMVSWWPKRPNTQLQKLQIDLQTRELVVAGQTHHSVCLCLVQESEKLSGIWTTRIFEARTVLLGLMYGFMEPEGVLKNASTTTAMYQVPGTVEGNETGTNIKQKEATTHHHTYHGWWHQLELCRSTV